MDMNAKQRRVVRRKEARTQVQRFLAAIYEALGLFALVEDA